MMNIKVTITLLWIALAVFVFGIAGEAYSQETVTATADAKTPEISLSTDRLDFDVSTGKIIVLKTLIISNIGTGMLTVEVSGLEDSGFRVLGRSNFSVIPGMKHFLMVYVFSASILQATEGMGADTHLLGSAVSDGAEGREAFQGKISAAGKKTPTTMSLKTNDPKHPEETIELAPLVPLTESATLNIKGLYHFSVCNDELINLTETGDIQLSFLYLPDKQYYNIVCGDDTCKGTTNISGTFPCANGCTVGMSQNNIQWIIYGKLSKDKTKLTLDVFHATEPEGAYTFTCPDNPPQSAPWSWIQDNTMWVTETMEYKEGAEKIVSIPPLGEKTYTLKNITTY
ncbi:MAG: hypothetical protein WCQ99_11965 [Pseudomonadota bacterium]